MVEKILKFADEYKMLPEMGLVLACVSGGTDSMCLLEVLRLISPDREFSIAVAHFNHNLRGEESDRDERFVKEYCKSCELPFYSEHGDVRLYAKQNKLSIETAARDMRYDFFYRLADNIGAEKIVTAHNADDNTETMLINFVRGAGTNGLGGIPPIREKVIRPMLAVSREEIEEFLAEQKIPHVEDSTNSDDEYTRNKIRHHITPIFKEINPRLNEAAGKTALLMREDEELLSEMADLFIKEKCEKTTVKCSEILDLPGAVSRRVLRKLYSGNLSFAHVSDIFDLCKNDNPSAKLSLPGMTVYRNYDKIIFGVAKESLQESFEKFYPKDGDSVIISEAGLKISCKSLTVDDKISGYDKSLTSFLFKSIDIYGTIIVRSRREGDRIKLLGHDGTKTLKKLFIERKIPAHKRPHIPVIADDEGVLAVYGLGRCERAIPKPGDIAMQIDFEEIQNLLEGQQL